MSKLSSPRSVQKALYISLIFFQKGVFLDNFSVVVVIIVEFPCRVYKGKYVLLGKNTFNTFLEKNTFFIFHTSLLKRYSKCYCYYCWRGHDKFLY